jgi:methylthioribose-1-phosphate isomerase
MAASFMARGEVDLVLVGTDRVTRNGDVVNKIGTLNLAVLCRHFGVPFYVACPSSTYDPATPSGIRPPRPARTCRSRNAILPRCWVLPPLGYRSAIRHST